MGKVIKKAKNGADFVRGTDICAQNVLGADICAQDFNAQNAHDSNAPQESLEESLESLRAKIDKCDDALVEILEKRLGIVAQIGLLKQSQNSSIYRPEREISIINRLAQKVERGLKNAQTSAQSCVDSNRANRADSTTKTADFRADSNADSKKPHLTKDAIAAVFYEIFAISRNLEMPQKIAYLGPIGSYTHQVANERFGALSQYIALNNITAVVKSVESGRAKYGVLPLENNTNGVVSESIDALASSALKIIAQSTIEIHHSLCSRAESLEGVRKIYSKAIAFGQCKQFLDALSLQNVELVGVESTSMAAKMAAEQPDSAAICSKIASKIYNLPIMFENIQDSTQNRTRFVVVSDFHNAASGNDSTAIFVTPKNFQKAGALLELLNDFKAANINLTKIDSRPLCINGAFSHGFFMEFDGHADEPRIKNLLTELSKRGAYKWLGSYPKE